MTDEKMSEEEKDALAAALKILVNETTRKAYRMIIDSTANLHEGDQWLVIGRIVNSVFQHHFHLSVRTSDQILNDRRDTP